MQINPERENLNGAKIYVDGVLKELKARTLRIDMKDYSTYGGTLATGFGGQFVTIPISGLHAQHLIENINTMLSVCIAWYSSGWRINYPNGRIFMDGDGTTLVVCFGTNWVNTGSIIDIFVIGV